MLVILFRIGFADAILMPAAEFELYYEVTSNVLTATIEYKLADYVENFPRFGIEINVDKAHGNFSYVGFCPSERYVDKHIACEYGYYVNSADENYDYEYIRPQESGSDYAREYLACGLNLPEEYEIPKTGKNTFKFTF